MLNGLPAGACQSSDMRAGGQYTSLNPLLLCTGLRLALPPLPIDKTNLEVLRIRCLRASQPGGVVFALQLDGFRVSADTL